MAKKGSQYFFLIATIMSLIMTASCGIGQRNQDTGPVSSIKPTPTAGPTGTNGQPQQNNGNDGDAGNTALNKVNRLISGMSIEEKIGQLLFISYRKDSSGKNALSVDPSLTEVLNKYHPGGFVLFSENIDNIDQTVSLISDIQSLSNIPLFISTDEEGGIITRLNKAPLLHSTVMPDAFAIGRTKNPENAGSAAGVIGQELLSLGFNMDFAPVADIFTNPQNKVIGKRAYGTEPDIVSLMVGSAVKGFSDQNIIPVLKHFPGHGDTTADTHTGAAEVSHDMKRLTSTELAPFKAGIEAGADAVMIAHILLPNVTTEPVPASLSKEIVTGILRDRMGFKGVVITDAMEMSAVSAYFSEEEAVVKAVLAGDDMVLMPVSIEKAFDSILNAVHEGTVSEERINESVRRILLLKEKYHILDRSIERPDPGLTLGNDAHKAVADKIRKEAGNQ